MAKKIDTTKGSAIMEAAKAGDAALVRKLSGRLTAPNILMHALFYAAQKGSVECVEILTVLDGAGSGRSMALAQVIDYNGKMSEKSKEIAKTIISSMTQQELSGELRLEGEFAAQWGETEGLEILNAEKAKREALAEAKEIAKHIAMYEEPTAEELSEFIQELMEEASWKYSREKFEDSRINGWMSAVVMERNIYARMGCFSDENLDAFASHYNYDLFRICQDKVDRNPFLLHCRDVLRSQKQAKAIEEACPAASTARKSARL